MKWLEKLIEQHRRQRVGAEIVDAYRRHPQTDDELAGLDHATRTLIDEEPWCADVSRPADCGRASPDTS